MRECKDPEFYKGNFSALSLPLNFIPNFEENSWLKYIDGEPFKPARGQWPLCQGKYPAHPKNDSQRRTSGSTGCDWDKIYDALGRRGGLVATSTSSTIPPDVGKNNTIYFERENISGCCPVKLDATKSVVWHLQCIDDITYRTALTAGPAAGSEIVFNVPVVDGGAHISVSLAAANSYLLSRLLGDVNVKKPIRIKITEVVRMITSTTTVSFLDTFDTN